MFFFLFFYLLFNVFNFFFFVFFIVRSARRSPADDMDPESADRSLRRPNADARVFVRGASPVDQLLDPGGRRDHCSR